MIPRTWAQVMWPKFWPVSGRREGWGECLVSVLFTKSELSGVRKVSVPLALLLSQTLDQLIQSWVWQGVVWRGPIHKSLGSSRSSRRHGPLLRTPGKSLWFLAHPAQTLSPQTFVWGTGHVSFLDHFAPDHSSGLRGLLWQPAAQVCVEHWKCGSSVLTGAGSTK